jgi:type IV secretory pathway TraG/TraD family ATPase VirD4
MHKYLYKIVLYLIKLVPIIISALTLLNIILSYFYIELEIFAHIGGVSLLFILFMYLTSVAFQFCKYHRMFIHYITVNWLLHLYDYYIGIPLANTPLLYLYLIITGIFLFIILYEYRHKRNLCKDSKRNS